MIDLREHYAGKKVLVTGGAGTIGRRLVEVLLELGAVVTIVDDRSSGSNPTPPGVTDREESIVDIAREGRWKEILGPDTHTVFHLAANFANQNSVDHPYDDLVVNGWGTYALLEACKEAGVRKVLFTSSSCVYGEAATEEEFDEMNVPLTSDTPYAMHKLLGEMYCNYFEHSLGLPTISVRLFNVFGPGERPGPYRNVIPNFAKLALEGKPLPVMGDGTATREFNFVDETVKKIAYVAACGPLERRAYNLAGGTVLSIRELAETVNRLAGNAAGIATVPQRSWDRIMHRVGNTRAFARTGYYENPSVAELGAKLGTPDTFEKQLEKTIGFVKENLS